MRIYFKINLKFSLPIYTVFAFFLIDSAVSKKIYAATIAKANNTTNLDVGGSWTGGVTPGVNDIASWTATVTGANSTLLGSNQSWRGLSVVAPGGLATIGAGNTLTLGYSGITMSAATQNLTISSGLSLLANSSQTWNVTAGRTLTLNTGTFTRNSGSSVNIQGAGTVSTTNITNTNGIIGPWASFGTGASTRYGTVTAGNISGLTGTAAATAVNVTDNTGTFNYDLAAAGALGGGVSVNTIRYTGGAGTLSGSFTGNGLMNAGTGTLTVTADIAMGSSNEFVFNTANGTIDTSGGVISGTGTLSQFGSNILTLYGNNTYDGTSNFNGATVFISSIKNVNEGASSLGNPTSASNGTIHLRDTALNYISGGTTSTDRIFNVSGTISSINSQGSGTLTLAGAISINMDSTFSLSGTENMTITGLITGSSVNGSFYNFSGGKTLTLSNSNNSFSGPVTIQQGNLSISSIANSGSNSDIGSGNTILFGSSGNNLTSQLQFTGTSGGSSNRSISIASGPASGGATIENTVSGQMLTLSGSVTAAGNGANNANLTLAGAGNITMSGNMNSTTNLLNITKSDAGTATLSGTLTNIGTTTVSGGILQFKNQVSLYNNTAGSWTAANIIVNSGATLALNVGGAGQFTSGNLNTLLALGTAGGGFRNGASVGLDTSDATGGNFTYSSVIANTNAGGNVLSLRKLGTNTLTLEATNTATGTFTIDQGTGVIGTASGGTWAGSVIANSGATLKGRGTIGGNVTINSGATYAPGNSPGIQSIVGNLTLASGSRTEIEIDGATAGNGAGFHDQINATGTVTIQSGATIAPMTIFSGSSGYTPSAGQRFAAITGSSVTGQFTTIDNTGNAAGLSFIPEYTSNTVFLRTTFSSFANNSALGLNGNQSQIATQLDNFRPVTIVTGASASDADRIYGALTLLNNEGVKNAITQMSPEKLAAMPQIAQGMGSRVHMQVSRQLELRRGFLPSQGDLSIYNRNGQTVYEPVAGILTDALFVKRKPDKLSFFASVNGEQGEVKPSQQRTDYDYWTATAVYGGNYALSESVNFGLFTSYGHSNTSLGGTGGKIDYDTGRLGGYASWSDEGWFVNGSLSGGKSFYETERRIAFLSETASGKTQAWEGVGELRAGKDLSHGKWTLSSSIWQRYSQSFIDSYQEQGSSARLNMGSMDSKSMVSGAGVSLQRAFPMGEKSLIPRVYTNYEREWVRSQEIQGRFAAGGTTFRVNSDPIDADQLTTGAGVAWLLSDQLQWDLSYEREALQNDLQRQSVHLRCKFSF